MLEARDLTIKYEARVAVANVSLKLAPGEITAIIGPNGAGKSTLLRALNGQVRRASGAVLLDGEAIEKFSRRSIGRRQVDNSKNQTEGSCRRQRPGKAKI